MYYFTTTLTSVSKSPIVAFKVHSPLLSLVIILPLSTYTKELSLDLKTILFFSIPLIKAIENTLSQKKQVILLINRRGFATSIQCLACGEVIKCKNYWKLIIFLKLLTL